MIVTVSVVGSALLFEAEPTQRAVVKVVKKRLVTEEEINDIIYTEGWAVSLMRFEERFHCAHQLLDRMKVVTENDESRLETSHYLEKRMLTIIIKGEGSLGMIGDVEIHETITLTDLRVIIARELEEALIPPQYRFIFRGVPCSLRQEGYRRAWECLPTCSLQVRSINPGIQLQTLSNGENLSSSKEKKTDGASQRDRTKNGSYYISPLHSLGQIRETSNQLYLLHNLSDSIKVGDQLKIGLLASRNYLVTSLEGKLVTISPSFDLGNGSSISDLLQSNYPRVSTADRSLFFPTYESLGFRYDCLRMTADDTMAAPAGETLALLNGSKNADTYLQLDKANMLTGSLTAVEDTSVDAKPISATGKRVSAISACVYTDLWLWKASTACPDTRPIFRRDYDNGLVPYKYTYQKSKLRFEYFRVKVSYALMEILCTDARCLSLTVSAQRADILATFPVDKFAQLVFAKLLEW